MRSAVSLIQGTTVSQASAFERTEPDGATAVRIEHSTWSMSRARVLVTGGSGFIGSHLTRRLLADGHEVVVLDNYWSGDPANIAGLEGEERLTVIQHDVVDPL